MVHKHIGVPYALLVAVVAGGGLFLPEFLGELALYDKETQKRTYNFALLFGVFLAPIAGLVADLLGH